jgi:hypothetical protein
MATPSVRLVRGRIHIGQRFSVSLQRTLRIPDDGRKYPLPAGLGLFPIHAAADYAAQVPSTWESNTFFAPVHQSEAMWLGFDAAPWKPKAVKVAVGRVNVVTGGSWSAGLTAAPQDYFVCPPQLWVDGINVGAEVVRQFVAAPLGLGHTIEGQVTGAESYGGIQIVVYEPRTGQFPDEMPDAVPSPGHSRAHWSAQASGMMGMGAGGTMRQKLYPDPHGIDVWNTSSGATAIVHLVNGEQYTAITGQPMPPAPIDAAAYTAHGLPWFDLYDEALGDLAPGETLQRVLSLQEIARQLDAPIDSNEPLEIPSDQVRRLSDRAQEH